jgi:hypothetical protein
MTTLREAAQQALEAMDKATRYMSFSDHRKLNEAITALKAALEQPERHVSYVCPQCHWSLEQSEQDSENCVTGCTFYGPPPSPYSDWPALLEDVFNKRRLVGLHISAQPMQLEQPVQEPVAWQWLNTAHFRKKLPADAERGAWNPLFTHPPRREWRGLTEEDVWTLAANSLDSVLGRLHFARACEAKLKELNHE